MKIAVISDTHGYHRKIKHMPKADVLVHCGDITNRGEIGILDDFANWMGELSYDHKIFISGNHDLALEREGIQKQELLKLFNECGLIYLQDSGIEINGVYFYGSPYTPLFHNWAWNLPRGGKELQNKWEQIPDQTNVLITHGPSYQMLDRAPRGVFDYEHVGCELLTNRIWELPKLKAHLYGHIHFDHGQIEEYGLKFVNGAICNEQYKPDNLPIVIDI